jgi:hypothetical protein
MYSCCRHVSFNGKVQEDVVEATNTSYVPMCQSDNTMATVATQKCKSQYLFAYFNLHTTMRDTSLSLLFAEEIRE